MRLVYRNPHFRIQKDLSKISSNVRLTQLFPLFPHLIERHALLYLFMTAFWCIEIARKNPTPQNVSDDPCFSRLLQGSRKSRVVDYKAPFLK